MTWESFRFKTCFFLDIRFEFLCDAVREGPSVTQEILDSADICSGCHKTSLFSMYNDKNYLCRIVGYCLKYIRYKPLTKALLRLGLHNAV